MVIYNHAENYAAYVTFARSLPSRTAYTRDELQHPSQRLYRDNEYNIKGSDSLMFRKD